MKLSVVLLLVVLLAVSSGEMGKSGTRLLVWQRDTKAKEQDKPLRKLDIEKARLALLQLMEGDLEKKLKEHCPADSAKALFSA